MKNFTFPLKEFINKGIALNNNKRNQPLLVESIGAIPYQRTLQAIEEFTRTDTSALSVSFPYPQLFVLSEHILVCTETKIYEIISGSLTLKIQGLNTGLTWNVIDFKSYIVLTNGQTIVEKSPETGEYAVNSTLPIGSCLCNFNGQPLIGSPTDQ